MKIFRKLLTAIAAIIILLFVAGFILPKKIVTERSILIEAPVDSVFPQVSYFSNMSTWSPWNDYDPDMEITYKGISGEVGSEYNWSGNKDVGKGNMTISAIEPNKRVDIKLSFVEPYESSSDIYFLFEDKGAQTEVKWGYFEKMKIPSNVMMAIMGVKKMLNKEFDKGLVRLKERCEE